MADVETSAGVIGIAVDGEGGVPILFLHGVGSDKSVWRRQLSHFGTMRTALALDYPGYGESAPMPDATRDDYARAAFAALDSLGIGEAHVCGLSLGGVLAIAMHHLAPKRCRSLILADTFAMHPDGQAIYQRSVAWSPDMRALAEGRCDALLAQPADRNVRREVIETMARIDPAAYVIGARAVWLADQRDRARAIGVPTLVLCGTEDRPTPPELSIELVSLISGARYQTIERAGHLTNLEQPDVFNALVQRFLAEVESGSACNGAVTR